jgi:hypothetical protein
LGAEQAPGRGIGVGWSHSFRDEFGFLLFEMESQLLGQLFIEVLALQE